MKYLTIIQARSNSTRLPSKVLLPIMNKPLLIHMVDRVKKSKKKGQIVVATSLSKHDNKIANLCEKYEINCFRGDENDLLDRHFKCAKKYGADNVLKIPSDCPLIDWEVIDDVIELYESSGSDYCSNLHPCTFPDGMDVEVLSLNSLKNAWQFANKKFEREHTTPYIWENPAKFKLSNLLWKTGLNYFMKYRLTIDYFEDYLLIKKIYENFSESNNDFRLDDIVNFLEKNPDIYKLNKKYIGVNWYRHHIDELKTIEKNQTRKINE